MDLKHIFSCLLTMMWCMAHVTGDTSSESAWLRRSLKAARRDRRTHNQNNNNIDENTDAMLETPTSQPKECCQNGGICIMNSFCHCKKRYYGRYCEHRVRHHSCGTIAHGTWMAAGCHICHCFDGNMICKVSDIPGCDNAPYVEAVDSEPEYQVDVDKKFEDYDTFYDGYDESPSSGVVDLAGSRTLLFGIFMLTTLSGNVWS